MDQFYGPNDNFDLENPYVLPVLIRKLYEVKIIDENKELILGIE